MRIAVSGTHLTGKSTLVAALGARLLYHATVPEPYEILEDGGYAFEYPPSIDDFVVQLRQSISILRRRTSNVILDRCPLDFVGYIHASRGADRFDLDRWREPISTAMASLDLVVAVRIDPGHDPVGAVEDAEFRRAVDALLREIVDDDDLDLCAGVEILPLGGLWDRRADSVMEFINEMRRDRLMPPPLPAWPTSARRRSTTRSER